MAQLHHRPIALLGLVTICVYGAWYYAFGVLLDPILADTGWNETALAGSFSAGLFGIGVGSLFGGRLLDQIGTRWVFLIAAMVGGLGLGTASFATSAPVFVVSAAVGMGSLGALGFYHVTMTAVVQLHPDESARAIAALTIWGAFASPLFLPLTAWLVGEWGWRTTMRLLLAMAIASLVLAALLLPSPASLDGSNGGPRSHKGSPQPLLSVARGAIATTEARAFTAAVALIGISISVILAYQVPVMSAAGLPLTTAATMAGIRGFSQLGGRLPLGLLVGRFGSRHTLLGALASIAVATVVLAVSGTVPNALAFALIAGFGIGAYSPLQGMYSAELFDHRSLGATMGLYTSVSMLAGSLGPVLAGTIARASGDRRLVAALATAAAVASVAALLTGRPNSGLVAGQQDATHNQRAD